MSYTDVQIANMAINKVGGNVVTALSDKDDILLSDLYSLARDAVLAMHEWKFAAKRSRVTASGILDCSAITIAFVDSDPDTMTDSSSALVTSGFEDGDVLKTEGSDSNNSSLKIDSVAAGTLTFESFEEVTAESLVNDTDLKLYATPSSEWSFKYPKPSDCLRVRDIFGSEEGDWDIEGDFIVTNWIDSNDQIDIIYTKRVEDETKLTDLFVKVFVYQLAGELVEPLAKDKVLRITLWDMAQNILLDGLAAMASEGNSNEKREDTTWQKSGR